MSSLSGQRKPEVNRKRKRKGTSIFEAMARYEGGEQGGVALKCELVHMDTKHVHRR